MKVIASNKDSQLWITDVHRSKLVGSIVSHTSCNTQVFAGNILNIQREAIAKTSRVNWTNVAMKNTFLGKRSNNDVIIKHLDQIK